jgi:hypothetical protein
MTVTEEMLMAYADGELDQETRAQVKDAIDKDPALNAVLDRHRALRSELRAAFDPVLEEAVPDRLVAAVRGSSRARLASNVLQFERTPGHTAPTHRYGWQAWISIAAGVVIGVAIGWLVWRSSVTSPVMMVQSSALNAQGSLAHALSQQLVSTQTKDDTVSIGLSFKDKAGDYCRTFATRGDSEFSGVACAHDGDWQIRLLTQASAEESDSAYRTAASKFPAAVLEAVNGSIAGEPLNADQEAQAKARNWHGSTSSQ